jgi:SAM-dependent methyltransferase
VNPASDAPSPFFVSTLPALADATRDGPLLDLACGAGRHALASAAAGIRTVALDRDAAALARLRAATRERAAAARERGLAARIHALRADLEGGTAIPLRPGAFGAVLVFRYLHRPLADAIASLLRPGGLLVYETFTTAQRALGRGPRNPAFLLEPGELPVLFQGLRTLSFEEGLYGDGVPEALARLLAVRPR